MVDPPGQWRHQRVLPYRHRWPLTECGRRSCPALGTEQWRERLDALLVRLGCTPSCGQDRVLLVAMANNAGGHEHGIIVVGRSARHRYEKVQPRPRARDKTTRLQQGSRQSSISSASFAPCSTQYAASRGWPVKSRLAWLLIRTLSRESGTCVTILTAQRLPAALPPQRRQRPHQSFYPYTFQP
jgi:hypothetical protein